MSSFRENIKGLAVALFYINFIPMAGVYAKEESDFQYLIQIRLSEKELILKKEGIEICRLTIAVPAGNYYNLPLSGEITKIIRNPYWGPTENTRKSYFKKTGKKLPEVVRPDDRRNAMGKAKFIIKFKNSANPIRIHGTNDSDSIGKRTTRGCIRLRNKDVLKIADIIKKSKTRVIINK